MAEPGGREGEDRNEYEEIRASVDGRLAALGQLIKILTTKHSTRNTPPYIGLRLEEKLEEIKKMLDKYFPDNTSSK